MPNDSTLILVNSGVVDSGTDGTGSGTDPTAAGGAVVTLKGNGGPIGIVCKLFEPTSDPAQAGATLDVAVELSVDGGTTWDTLCSFRRFDGSEVANQDNSTGSPTVRRAQIVNVPRPDAGSTVQLRGNTTASATTNWGLYLAVTDPGSIEADDLFDNIAN